jgi:hypothetical protein
VDIRLFTLSDSDLYRYGHLDERINLPP